MKEKNGRRMRRTDLVLWIFLILYQVSTFSPAYSFTFQTSSLIMAFSGDAFDYTARYGTISVSYHGATGTVNVPFSERMS